MNKQKIVKLFLKIITIMIITLLISGVNMSTYAAKQKQKKESTSQSSVKPPASVNSIEEPQPVVDETPINPDNNRKDDVINNDTTPADNDVKRDNKKKNR